jgi:hypothetical protein
MYNYVYIYMCVMYIVHEILIGTYISVSIYMWIAIDLICCHFSPDLPILF